MYRYLCTRNVRLYLPVLFSFLLGVAITALLETSETSKDEFQPIETTTETPVTEETLTKQPYPPLIEKKGLIITPRKCPTDLFLLILVVTSSRNFEARKAIRSSWGEDSSKKNETSAESFRVTYVVGWDDNNNRLLKREAKRYQDILRGGFEDSYGKNEEHSVKALLGLKWATTSCKAKFILKASSESFVNVPSMMSYLRDKTSSESGALGLYLGFCHGKNVGGAKVVRNKGSQWYISEEDWPDKRLPPYASGMGITFSYDVVEKIVAISTKEKIIHIDDVYLGIMAKKLSIPCVDEPTRFDTSYTTMLTECEDLTFCVLGGVPIKDMFYLSQNVGNLKDIC